MPKLSEIEVTKDSRLSNFTISINDCIALCKVIGRFKSFSRDLKGFSEGLFGYKKLKSLYNYVKDKKSFVIKDIKIFYQNNEDVLNAIHENTYISNFLFIYFDREKGKFNQEITQMYEYLKNNKDNKDKILLVLNKLSNLGFGYINFSEDEQFDDEYRLKNISQSNYFVDGNIKVIPSLECFKYKTEDANYEIEFSTFPFHKPKITLNNLTFDSNLLPKNLSYDDTMKKIVDLKNEIEESYKVLDDCVKTDYNLGVMIPAIEKVDEIINNIHNSKYQNNVKEHINKAKESIYELKDYLDNYQTDMVEQSLVTEEILYEETKKYKRKNS